MIRNVSAVPFLVWTLLAMPALGVLSYFHLRSGKPLAPKRRRFLVTMLAEVLLLALALDAAPPSLVLFPATAPDAPVVICVAVFLGAMLTAVSHGLKRMPAERRQKARLLMPETPAEFRLWAVIPLLAGVCEETAYRGVLYRLLTEELGSPALAIAVAVAAFAAAHATQGFRATLGIAAMAGLFHMLVALTGTLYLAMAVHVVYDFVLGFLLMRSLHAERQAAPEASPA